MFNIDIAHTDRKLLGALLVVASLLGLLGISAPITIRDSSGLGKVLLLFLFGFGIILILSDIFNWV